MVAQPSGADVNRGGLRTRLSSIKSVIMRNPFGIVKTIKLRPVKHNVVPEANYLATSTAMSLSI